MTRYQRAFSWPPDVDRFLREVIQERPLLAVCSGRSDLGDVRADRYERCDVRADWLRFPFGSDSFGAVFADPPWGASYKSDCSRFFKEAIRVAPVVYLMAPFVVGMAGLARSYWVREIPGITTPVLLTRYSRSPSQAHVDGEEQQ
jgi:hypothetical protein